MIVRASPERPVIFALGVFDREVVDAGDANAHQAAFVEFPVLVAVAAVPLTAVVGPLIGEADGDTVLGKGPEFFDQSVIELSIPLARQERFDRFAALEKFRAIAPAAVDRIAERDARGVTRVPGILRE